MAQYEGPGSGTLPCDHPISRLLEPGPRSPYATSNLCMPSYLDLGLSPEITSSWKPSHGQDEMETAPQTHCPQRPEHREPGPRG